MEYLKGNQEEESTTQIYYGPYGIILLQNRKNQAYYLYTLHHYPENTKNVSKIGEIWHYFTPEWNC